MPSPQLTLVLTVATHDLEARHHLRSASSPSLVVHRTRLSTYGDRAFPVAASRVWSSLPHHVTSAQSLPVFCSRLKTRLFSRSFRCLYCCAHEVTLVITDTLIVVVTYLLTHKGMARLVACYTDKVYPLTLLPIPILTNFSMGQLCSWRPVNQTASLSVSAGKFCSLKFS